MSHTSSSGSVANSTSTSGSVAGATTPTVLGATAPTILGGAAILPVTGNDPLIIALVVTSMTIAAMVLASFFVSRIVRKFI